MTENYIFEAKFWIWSDLKPRNPMHVQKSAALVPVPLKVIIATCMENVALGVSRVSIRFQIDSGGRERECSRVVLE